MRIPQVLAGLFVLLLAVACKGPEETVVQQVPPPVVKDTTINEPEPVREFAFTERYFVPGAALGDPTKVDDPLQAMRVIQLEPGSANVLVIADISRNDEGSGNETWFGVELPSSEPNTYDLSTLKAQYFKFTLGGSDMKRVDGQSYEGSLHVEGMKDGYLIGSINANIMGLMRSREAEPRRTRMELSGSFRIQQVRLEDTVIGR